MVRAPRGVLLGEASGPEGHVKGRPEEVTARWGLCVGRTAARLVCRPQRDGVTCWREVGKSNTEPEGCVSPGPGRRGPYTPAALSTPAPRRGD